MEKIKQTPLYNAHVALKARMVPFAGYSMPVQYSGVLEETKSTRSHCGLFDVSHMGQLVVRGKEPREFLQRMVTNDLSKIALGQAQYNMLCNPSGGIIDDIIVYRRSENELFICVNASNKDTDHAWLKEHLMQGFELEDQSDQWALLALQGPRSEALLLEISKNSAIQDLKYYWAMEANLFGTACYLARTGYTGEDGFEIYVPASDAEKAWDTILSVGKNHGVQPIGLGARDTLRLEMGYPLHGHEISPTISPFEAGLGWVVKLDVPTQFIGKEALEREKVNGSKRKLIAVSLNDRRIPRADYLVSGDGGKTTHGKITSGTHSPHLNYPIALALVDAKIADQDKVYIQIRDQWVEAAKALLPFVPSKTKRKNTPKSV